LTCDSRVGFVSDPAGGTYCRACPSWRCQRIPRLRHRDHTDLSHVGCGSDATTVSGREERHGNHDRRCNTGRLALREYRGGGGGCDGTRDGGWCGRTNQRHGPAHVGRPDHWCVGRCYTLTIGASCFLKIDGVRTGLGSYIGQPNSPLESRINFARRLSAFHCIPRAIFSPRSTSLFGLNKSPNRARSIFGSRIMCGAARSGFRDTCYSRPLLHNHPTASIFVQPYQKSHLRATIVHGYSPRTP
jgi:hypothetical protein